MMQRKQRGWIKAAALLCIIVVCVAPYKAYAYKDKYDAELVVSRIIIDVQGIQGDRSRWVDTVKNLIFLYEGKPFSIKRFQDSLEALKSSNLFKAIHVSEPDQRGEKFILRFQVTPYPLVKDIKITGAFPLLEKEVLSAMSLHTGDAYHPEKFSDKETALVRRFKKEGYIAPAVNLTSTEDPEDGNFVVYVHIDKGDFFHVRCFVIMGNRAFSDMRLKLRLGTWKSSLLPNGLKRFREKKFDKDIKNLIRFYRGKGYPDVVVNSVIDKDIATQSVSIGIKIDEGPLYIIEFQGNKMFWDYTLKKDLLLFKEGNKNGFGLRKSIRKIKQRYLNAGYLDCQIKTQSENVQEKGRSLRKIRMIIKEGPQYVVKTVNFVGNHAFDSKKINKQVLTRTPGLIATGGFVKKTLEEDKRAITLLYRQKGYRNVNVQDQVKWGEPDKKNRKKVDVTFDIKEGVQTHVTSVTIRGLNVLPESQAIEAIALKKGAVFRRYMMQGDENILSSLISEKGYSHVKVKGTADMSKNNSEAAITYDVDEGPFAEMGNVTYTGNFITKGRVIENEIELDSGEAFSLKKFLESQRNIRNIDAFESVRFKTFGLKEEEDRVNLLMEIEEKKPYYIQFGGGYGTETGLYGNILGGDHNLFGLNKDVWAKVGVSQTGYRGDLGLTEPRFIGTRIKSATNIFAEKSEPFNVNFGTRSAGVSISFYRKFLKNFSATLSLSYEYRDQYPRNSEPILPGEEDEFSPRNTFLAKPSLVYSSMDSYVRPKKGLFSMLSVDISKGIDNSLDDFLKYRFEVRKYITPFERLTFALRGRVGYIDSFSSANKVPEDQLFFLGGASTVRGYSENLLRFEPGGNAVGGLGEILANVEARIDLGRNYEFSIFYDTGSVRDPVDSAVSQALFSGSNAFRSGVGVGLHYITPVGPIGVYYGHKLNRIADESPGEFYFTMGFRF